MRWFVKGCAPVLFALAALCGAGEVEIPLELKEPSGVRREAFPVTTGLPLPVGLAKDTGRFVLLDVSSRRVPAQFGVQSRWVTRDGSIRWLLVDAQASLAPDGLARFTLARRPEEVEAPQTPLRVHEDAQAVTVVTGPLKFIVAKKRGFQLLSAAWLDLDGDGQFAEAEQMVAPGEADGFSLLEMGTKKWHRSSASPPRSVAVETSGPLRVVVKVDGTHTAEGGVEGGCYDYTARVYAYAGKPYVRVQHTLKNLRFTKPSRSWQFSDGCMATTVKVSAGARYTFGGDPQVHSGTLAEGQVASLYQDSEGGANWNKVRPNRYAEWPDGTIPGVTFRGYKLRHGPPAKLKELAAGDAAPGWVDLSDGTRGLTVGVLDFAPQYPKALDVEGTRLLARLYAPYGARTHWLECNTCKTHELVYLFHKGGCDPKQTQDLLAAFEEPGLLVPKAAWVSASDAWTMGLHVPEAPRTHKQSPRVRYGGRAGGWERRGAFWSKGALNCGGYHTNMDTVLGRTIQTGDYQPFRRWSLMARAMAELIPWSPEGLRFAPGVTKHTQKTLDGIPLIPNDARTGKPALTPDDYERYRYWVARIQHSPYLKKEDGFATFEGYDERRLGRPDSGHFGIYPVVETYHLTGDPVLREGLERMAEVLKFQIGHRNGFCPASSYGARYQGWYQLGLAQIYGCTNDPTILPYLHMTARATLEHIRKNPRGFFGHKPNEGYGEKLFFVSGLVGGLYSNFLLTRNEDARDAIIALNDWVVHFVGYTPRDKGGDGLPYMWIADRPREWKGQWHPRRTIPFAVGYLLTGRKDIYDIGHDIYRGKPDELFGAYQLWLTVEKRRRSDTVPPAPVRDLAVKPLGGGAVEVTFTSPGDDGGEGKPAEYQVKWSTLPIVEAIQWPEQKDTHRAFWWARNVASEPAPVEAGRRATVRIEGLKPGRLWFAVKAFDEASNISALSNVVAAEVK